MPKPKEIIVVVGVLVIFAIAFIIVLRAYDKESEKQAAAITDTESKKNYIKVYAKLVSIDPVKGDVTARLEFEPKGDLTTDQVTLDKNLRLYVNGATGKQEHTFEKGKVMNPTEVVLNLYNGNVMDYPFDKHEADLIIYFASATKEEKPKSEEKPKTSASPSSEEPKASPSPAPEQPAATPAEGAAKEAKKETTAASNDEDDVPIDIDFTGSIPGMQIEAAKTKDSTADYVDVAMRFSRSTTTKFFSFFVMITMWGVTLVVFFLTLSIVLRGRKIEIGMFSFLGALLFAFVAFRGTQPGTPPIGTFGDYISFFWAELIIALCLLTIIFTWLRRPTAK